MGIKTLRFISIDRLIRIFHRSRPQGLAQSEVPARGLVQVVAAGDTFAPLCQRILGLKHPPHTPPFARGVLVWPTVRVLDLGHWVADNPKLRRYGRRESWFVRITFDEAFFWIQTQPLSGSSPMSNVKHPKWTMISPQPQHNRSAFFYPSLADTGCRRTDYIVTRHRCGRCVGSISVSHRRHKPFSLGSARRHKNRKELH